MRNILLEKIRRGVVALVAGALSVLFVGVSAASAETLLMPKRDFLMGQSEVVWGITRQANGTPFVLDYGDGSQTSGNVADRSYIAFNHTYAAGGAYTVRLCVGAGAVIPGCPGEQASVVVNVYDPATLSAFDLRGLNINRTIQDGLRYLWTTQVSRANLESPVTNWAQGSGHGGVEQSVTALAVLSFENHGYLLAGDGSAPTGIYEKYIVERGLNFLASTLTQLNLTMQPAGNPCVGAGAGPDPDGAGAALCVGLYDPNDPGYANGVIALPFAGSTALNRTFPGGLGGTSGAYVAGKTYGEVLQRILNATYWGQIDGGTGRGGWSYQFANNNSFTASDGSTVGWDVLALLDAGAAGAVIPAFVKSEFAFAVNAGQNTNGSFDYQADGNQASLNNVNFQKGGILLQALFYLGQVGTADSEVNAAVNYLDARWSGAPVAGDAGFWACGSPATNNIPCVYGMFNAFKGLKLQGVQTLSNVNRPAGPGPIPEDDWHAAYQDWLVTNQAAAGNWPALGWSCCQTTQDLSTAGGLLILAPVALIQPDPVFFSEFGLSQEDSVNPPGTPHTVVARTRSADDQPVAGVTIDFRVISGPNQGVFGQAVTNAQGEAEFTYIDTSTGPYPKQDQIQAFIGQLGSNIIVKSWVLVCDPSGDGDIDSQDISMIRAANGQAASPLDPRDGNGDGTINVLDARYCQLRCTRPNCAMQ